MKFRKKPIVVEAEQFFPDHKPWPEGVIDVDGELPMFGVRTLEGLMEAREGDWIITGIQGERYPCKPDIFAATYEPAP